MHICIWKTWTYHVLIKRFFATAAKPRQGLSCFINTLFDNTKLLPLTITSSSKSSKTYAMIHLHGNQSRKSSCLNFSQTIQHDYTESDTVYQEQTDNQTLYNMNIQTIRHCITHTETIRHTTTHRDNQTLCSQPASLPSPIRTITPHPPTRGDRRILTLTKAWSRPPFISITTLIHFQPRTISRVMDLMVGGELFSVAEGVSKRGAESTGHRCMASPSLSYPLITSIF